MEKDNNKSHKKGAVDKELKKILDKQERQELLFNADILLPTKTFDVELEQHQLKNGTQFTIKGIKDLINNQARDYSPMFPNEKPFYKLMYKLLDWKDRNPNDFIKPGIVGVYTNRYIYARFDKDVLPTLLAIDNPLTSGYIRKYKLFQFLTDEGLTLLEGFIQESIDVMAISKDWYDFELKL